MRKPVATFALFIASDHGRVLVGVSMAATALGSLDAPGEFTGRRFRAKLCWPSLDHARSNWGDAYPLVFGSFSCAHASLGVWVPSAMGDTFGCICMFAFLRSYAPVQFTVSGLLGEFL